MSAESKFQNHIHENKCEAHMIKQVLKEISCAVIYQGNRNHGCVTNHSKTSDFH